MEMTPEQMSKMVLTKYNDTVNKGESHRIDLFSTAPYVIRTDGYDAVEVIFPGLVPGRKYRVAMGDYVFKNYRGLEYTNGETTQWLVPDVLMEYVANGGKPSHPTIRSGSRSQVSTMTGRTTTIVTTIDPVLSSKDGDR